MNGWKNMCTAARWVFASAFFGAISLLLFAGTLVVSAYLGTDEIPGVVFIFLAAAALCVMVLVISVGWMVFMGDPANDR